MNAGSAICSGEVIHVRLRPRNHRLRYRVFSLLLDVDDIDGAASRMRLFSRNRFNLVSFHDRDHGAATGIPVGDHARTVFREAGLEAATHRVLLLAYPRILGYVFNPLVIYFGYDGAGALAGVIYEVNNTVGERTSYVIAAGEPTGGVYAHGCEKSMYVSPFTPAAARYAFRLRATPTEILAAVLVSDGDGALLRTHFKGKPTALDDRALGAAICRHPLLTFKVIAAIHWEALRLFLKGVPVVRRHRSPRFTIAWGPASRRG